MSTFSRKETFCFYLYSTLISAQIAHIRRVQVSPWAAQSQAMLTESYIEALLVDPEAADAVWEAWDAGLIPDELAAVAWWFVVVSSNGCKLVPNEQPD